MAEPGGAADDPVRKVQKTLGVALFDFLSLLKGGSSWADNIPVHERPSRSSPLPPSNPLLSYHHSLHKARAGAGTGPLPSWQPCLPQGRAVAGVQGGVGLAVPGGRGSCVWKGGEGRWTLLLGVILLLGPIDRWRRWHCAFQATYQVFLLLRPTGTHLLLQAVQYRLSLSRSYMPISILALSIKLGF